MDAAVRRHCRELDRCNQRGGRMLSMLDLIDAGTLDLDLAAWLMVRIARGASFMVGARPGGAGKTTVMCALLNLVPPDMELVAATAEVVRQASATPSDGRRCFVCHEIGAGPYFAYLWGAPLRAYCALQEKGYMLATSLHADDLQEAREQVCAENAVPEMLFNGFSLMIFLRMSGAWPRQQRRVDVIWHSEERQPHRCVYDARRGIAPHVSTEEQVFFMQCRGFLEEQHQCASRAVEALRHNLLPFYAAALP